MIKIDYPAYDFQIKQEAGKEYIFDSFRKRWIRLTPEEWVRQNMLQYLVQTKQYPSTLIAIEKEITIGELKKRFDILVYKDSKPWMIIECKEREVSLNESVIKQILNYNINLQASFLLITNGIETYAFKIMNEKIEQLDKMPDF
jgi:hypothetical protein